MYSSLNMRTLATAFAACFATAAMAQDFSVIRTQPEGELHTYIRDGGAFYAYYGEATMTSQNYTVIDIVTAPDGKTIYMKNPISQASTDTWVTGTIEDDGKIHVPLGQCVQYFDIGYGWKTTVLKLLSYDDWEGAQYYIADLMDEVTFSISADPSTGSGQATITMDDLGGPEGQGGYPGAMYALIYTDDNSFVGYADYESVYTPYNMSVTTIPEGLDTEMWDFTYSNAREGEVEHLPVATDGQNLYIAGLSLHDPEAAIVGHIDTSAGEDQTKVSFASDQYVGYHSGFLLYAFGASYETKTFYDEVWDETYTTNVMTPQPTIDFDYDTTTGKMTAIGDAALVLNMGKVNEVGINYMSVSLDPEFQGTLNLDGIQPSSSYLLPPTSYLNYDLNGRSTSASRSGVTIVRMADGTTRKMVVKH